MTLVTVKEYEEITETPGGLSKKDLDSLKELAGTAAGDEGLDTILQLRKGRLYAHNYVGVITVNKGTVLEILPKVDLATTDIRKVFLNMLRYWRGSKFAQFRHSNVRALKHFNMLEVFFRLFIENLVLLTQRGLARHYHAAQDNLPYLKGRILFPQHIYANLITRTRFYVEYDEFSADRPANRLIHSTITRLMSLAREPVNQQLLHELKIFFSDVPLSVHLESDWCKHQVDRSMQHYEAVMQWVGLFLFGSGLSTFAGDYESNHALLFPMEKIYEDFVTHCFRAHQSEFSVRAQAPRIPLARIDGKGAFHLRPDISLMDPGGVKYILDAKWKRINRKKPKAGDYGISQSDVYQLYTYGKRYGCKTVALVYPRTKAFKKPFHCEFEGDALKLLCLPFDLTDPKQSVAEAMDEIGKLNCDPPPRVRTGESKPGSPAA